MKKKAVSTHGKTKLTKKLVNKLTLRQALVSGVKAQTGRKDIEFRAAADIAATTQRAIPIEERAGYPLKRARGSVDPKNWKTATGVKLEVDFSRAWWMPDDWGQAIKPTKPTSHSTGGGGGILTTFVAPDGKTCFFHKERCEEHMGRPFTKADGFNGQVRLAKLQALQSVQLARRQIKASKTGSQQLIGTDSDSTLFNILSPKERKFVIGKDEFHFCVVSARRATSVEGVRDIFMVQTQFTEAGVMPTWYVDEASLKDYTALGLRAVVGGKLTQARNKCLDDAQRKRKVCVQVSDDISAWEYRDGKNAKVRTDDALNAAHDAARRIIASPVAAARFVLAKMRGADDPKPKLGGAYMLGSCSRTFYGNAFSRSHFILGDFLVVDISEVRFDESMNLKEDYDFSCSHIKAHGSVMRCNRMTLNVKHYDNGGGACTNRDKKGEAERRNIEILNQKWPGMFRPNPKRKNEVIMKWTAAGNPNESAESDDEEDVNGQQSSSAGSSRRRDIAKNRCVKGTVGSKKLSAKKPAVLTGLPPMSAVLVSTGKKPKAPHIASRCKRVVGRSVERALSVGGNHAYLPSDLRYDLLRGFLAIKRGVRR